MDIHKYFATLKKINTFFAHNNPLWKDSKTKAIEQNHWLTNNFIDLKTIIIVDTFLAEKNYPHWESFFSQPPNSSQKIALVVEDNNIFSGIYDLLIGFGFQWKMEIKCLPHHKTLLQPIVQILNHEKEQIFFVEKFSKDYTFFSLYKKEKLSSIMATYFKKYPHIVHTPKRGIAIIEGNEKKYKLQLLGKHIFSFFGMDNLSIGKIFLPEKYDINLLFENFEYYFPIKNHAHYALQYDYHLATIILQKKRYFTNGLITLVENEKVFSPISVLNFEYYTQISNLFSLKNNDVSYIIKTNDLEENTMQKLELENRENRENKYPKK